MNNIISLNKNILWFHTLLVAAGLCHVEVRKLAEGLSVGQVGHQRFVEGADE